MDGVVDGVVVVVVVAVAVVVVVVVDDAVAVVDSNGRLDADRTARAGAGPAIFSFQRKPDLSGFHLV